MISATQHGLRCAAAVGLLLAVLPAILEAKPLIHAGRLIDGRK